ncbi:alpha/beta fold hydrolase [Streptomyces sp. S1D4-11]
MKEWVVTELNISTAAGVFDAIVEGPPEGRPVLLLHGFPQTGLAWLRQIAALAAHGYRVLAPNQRGYSPASAPSGPRATTSAPWSTMSSRSRTNWAGRHSTWSAMTGEALWRGGPPMRIPAAYALSRLSRPRTPALSPTPLRTDENQRNRSRYMIDWRETPATEDDMLANGAEKLRAIYAGRVPQASVDAYIRHLSQPGALTAALNWYRVGRPERAIGVIEVPTLYVWSTQDTAFGPAAAQETGQWVQGPYRFEDLQGVSHWIPEEAPETLNHLLLEHLQAHGEYGTTAIAPPTDSRIR